MIISRMKRQTSNKLFYFSDMDYKCNEEDTPSWDKLHECNCFPCKCVKHLGSTINTV